MKDVELMRFNESWNLMSLIQFKRYISEFWCILVPFCGYLLMVCVNHATKTKEILVKHGDVRNHRSLLVGEV